MCRESTLTAHPTANRPLRRMTTGARITEDPIRAARHRTADAGDAAEEPTMTRETVRTASTAGPTRVDGDGRSGFLRTRC
jgi:hypothetical protein